MRVDPGCCPPKRTYTFRGNPDFLPVQFQILSGFRILPPLLFQKFLHLISFLFLVTNFNSFVPTAKKLPVISITYIRTAYLHDLVVQVILCMKFFERVFYIEVKKSVLLFYIRTLSPFYYVYKHTSSLHAGKKYNSSQMYKTTQGYNLSMFKGR